MAILEKLENFDPSGVGNTSMNIFGLPVEVDESRLVFIPVPWDVTASNDRGTANAPEIILRSSYQIDLHDPLVPNAWKEGMAMEKIDPVIKSRNLDLGKMASRLIRFLETGGDPDDRAEMNRILDHVNQASAAMLVELEVKCLQYMEKGQIPFLVGGDHSVSLGLISALARNESFGILQIDAHADMRESYQGFYNSHASVMFNALELDNVAQIVQVGTRELCQEEVHFISENHKRVKTFFDHDLQQRLFSGESWASICKDIADRLPENIYLSFDVDGLDPSVCPNTGTPVPGGLTYHQVIYLLETIYKEGKRFLGADLVETGPGRLDGIVSSRLLYRIAGMLIGSNQ